jgi:hypothetical protein
MEIALGILFVAAFGGFLFVKSKDRRAAIKEWLSNLFAKDGGGE